MIKYIKIWHLILLIISLFSIIIGCKNDKNTDDSTVTKSVSNFTYQVEKEVVIAKYSGDNQLGTPGQALPEKLFVRVTDQDGIPVKGIKVNFEDKTSISVVNTQVISDEDGFSSLTWTLGKIIGIQSMVVTALKSDGITPFANSPIFFTAKNNFLYEYPAIIYCEGTYSQHLQGICTDKEYAIFWSWTDELVKTDMLGKILKRIKVVSHHGDLCYNDGKIYVTVNLGQFNISNKANSWIYVYDANSLLELAKYAIPDLIYGAGGISFHNGKFMVIGGLDSGINENYVYEYDMAFNFLNKHTLFSGYTNMGIQTIEYGDGYWWLGTYDGLIRADENLNFIDKRNFDASYGIAYLPGSRFLIGKITLIGGTNYSGRAILYKNSQIVP